MGDQNTTESIDPALEQTVKFIFELGMLKKTPRTGYQFLGRGHENVAAHSYRVAMIAFILARSVAGADAWRCVGMALMHDVAEARTADHNYVNRRYVQVDEDAATRDQLKGLAFGPELAELKGEFEEEASLEARLARDADQLDLIFELREHQDLGNPYAPKWIESAKKRLLTHQARQLAEEAMRVDWTGWWFDQNDSWWVDGGRNREEK